MKFTKKVKQDFDVKLLKVEAGVRYWEDATVNGKEDVDGTLIPFRDGDYWKPTIDIEKGFIIRWPEGVVAQIHYKCCDDGQYTLLDKNDNVISQIDDFVPFIMCPKENGYGDYIKMDIDENGFIKNYKPDLNDFK